MNSIKDFHSQLAYLSASTNEDQLTKRVLGDTNSIKKGTDKRTDLAKIVSDLIEKFIKNNAHQFNCSDVPALSNLQGLIHKLTVKFGLQEEIKGKTSQLERTISNTITLASSKMDSFILKQKSSLLCQKYAISFNELDFFLNKYNYQLDGMFNGETPFTEAIKQQKNSIFKILLELNTDINNVKKRNNDESTPLVLAVEMNNYEIVKLFKDIGININECNKYGETILEVAVGWGYVDIVKLLINIDAHKMDSFAFSAVLKNNKEMFKLLKAFAVDANKCTHEDHALLLNVSDESPLEIVKLLKNWGIDAKKCIERLFLAVDNNNLAMVKLLTSLGADVNKCNEMGKSPLLVAVNNNNFKMVKLLKIMGADVNKCDLEGNSPLLCAVINNHLEMVALLKSLGADVDKCNYEGNSPLLLAAAHKHIEMMELLKSLGADVNKCNLEGGSPLMLAVNNNHLEMVKLLKKLGADVNQCNLNGDSPLLLAVEHNFFEMVKLLKSLGADVTKSNKDAEFPLLVALGKRQINMVALLDPLGIETWAEEIHDEKILCHIWGIGGTFTSRFLLNGVPYAFKAEGYYEETAIERLSLYVNRLFELKKITDAKDFLISKNDQAEIQESIANAFPLVSSSNNDIVTVIKAGKPFVIMGGFEDHVISIVIAKNQLVIFNRGAGRKANAGEIYSFSASMINELFIEKLKTIHRNIEEFNKTMNYLILNFKLTYLRGFAQKDQKVGNCSWASAKGAFRGLYELYSNKEASRIMYKELSFLARKLEFEAYLKKPNVNPEIIEKIKQKCIKKQGQWLELIQKLPEKKVSSGSLRRKKQFYDPFY